MKRGLGLFFIAAVIIFSVAPIISANPFSDFWGKLTGQATSGSTSLNITVGNNAPTIPIVQSISAQNPTEDSVTSVRVNFTVNDADGYSNINTSSAKAYFQKSGQTTRSNTSCVSYQSGGNQVNFTCLINMYYFDGSGSWTINVTGDDINSAHAENSSTTFTYNLLTAMKISPSSLTFPSISLTDTNTGATNNPITVNDTGNANNLNLNVTAYNLRGETTTNQYIYANNFTVDNVTAGCSGVAMANATSVKITNQLSSGNHTVNDGSTGQKPLYFCLKGVPPTISSQSYSSSAYGSWTIAAS